MYICMLKIDLKEIKLKIYLKLYIIQLLTCIVLIYKFKGFIIHAYSKSWNHILKICILQQSYLISNFIYYINKNNLSMTSNFRYI